MGGGQGLGPSLQLGERVWVARKVGDESVGRVRTKINFREKHGQKLIPFFAKIAYENTNKNYLRFC